MKDFTFTLTEQEANIVLNGLGKLPAEISLTLILKIQELAKEQLNEVQELKAEK